MKKPLTKSDPLIAYQLIEEPKRAGHDRDAKIDHAKCSNVIA